MLFSAQDRSIGIEKEVDMRRTACVLAMCGLVLGIAACGSDSGVAKTQRGDDGRVFVRNETGTLNPDSREVDITVTYIDENRTTHKTVVAAGQREDITGDELIKGGEEVLLTVEATPSDGRHADFKQTIRIRTSPVDGNIEIRIVAVRDGSQLEGTGFEIVV